MSAPKKFELIEECEISVAQEWIEFLGRYDLEVIHILSDFTEDGEPVAGVFVEEEAFEELMETDEIFAGNFEQIGTLLETIEIAIDKLNEPVQVMLVLEEDDEGEYDCTCDGNYDQMSMYDYEDLDEYDACLDFSDDDIDD